MEGEGEGSGGVCTQTIICLCSNLRDKFVVKDERLIQLPLGIVHSSLKEDQRKPRSKLSLIKAHLDNYYTCHVSSLTPSHNKVNFYKTIRATAPLYAPVSPFHYRS